MRVKMNPLCVQNVVTTLGREVRFIRDYPAVGVNVISYTMDK